MANMKLQGSALFFSNGKKAARLFFLLIFPPNKIFLAISLPSLHGLKAKTKQCWAKSCQLSR